MYRKLIKLHINYDLQGLKVEAQIEKRQPKQAKNALNIKHMKMKEKIDKRLNIEEIVIQLFIFRGVNGIVFKIRRVNTTLSN